MADHETLILNLHRARKARDEAKEKHREKAAEVGGCAFEGRLVAHGYPDEPPEPSGPCYMDLADDPDEWCDACAAKEPLRRDYQKKATAAGAALRAVLLAGKKLADAETENP